MAVMSLLSDSWSDGICCGGYFKLFVENDFLVFEGGVGEWDELSKSFCKGV